MKLVETPLSGAYVIEPEPVHDERGFFARIFSSEALQQLGLVTSFVQSSISFNRKKGTLRGLHFQVSPHEETKLVRCTGGRVFDVIVDIRSTSPSFGRWYGLELSAENRLTLYVPAGFAHGFQTLEDSSEVHYQISIPYVADCARGISWKDPSIAISWPLVPSLMSERDRALPNLSPA